MSRFPLPGLASPASVFVVTFLTLSLLAAAFPDGAAATGEPVGEPSKQASEQPPVRERTWHETLAPAQAEAAKTGKLIFVDLFADWCGWCHVLDKNVFAAPVFDSLAERLVLVRIDVENGDEGAHIQSRYQVSGLPTTLILEASGILVGKVTGVAEPVDYVQNIEMKIEVHQQVIDLYERVIATRGKEVETEQMQALAEAFHKRLDGARAAELYRLLETRDPEDPALLAFRLADALRLRRDYQAAAESAARARTLADGHPSGDKAGSLIESIDLLQIQIATEQGDCARRRKTLESFLELYPDSQQYRRVESTLVALETGTDGTGCSGARG